MLILLHVVFQDGRILFMDAQVYGKKFFEFKANKDKVRQNLQNLTYKHACMITQMVKRSSKYCWRFHTALVSKVNLPSNVHESTAFYFDE